jgi:hypothetical protein
MYQRTLKYIGLLKVFAHVARIWLWWIANFFQLCSFFYTPCIAVLPIWSKTPHESEHEWTQVNTNEHEWTPVNTSEHEWNTSEIC